MQLQVIYDPELEIATVIDSEEFRSMGPVAVGPHAQAQLTAFTQTMPPTVFMAMSSYELVRTWGEFWEREFSALYETPPETDNDSVGGQPTVADYADALAERTATETSDTPDVQSHDTDVAVVTSPSNTVTAQCYNCNGDGFIEHGETGEKVTCGICNGTGKVTLPA